MFDRVIVSTDEDKRFVQFVPLVSAAWKRFFPEVALSIAFVTDRNLDDPLIQNIQKYGDIHLYPTVPGVPTANLAKMSRHLTACKFADQVCMIEDMDTIPLQREYFENRTSHRRPGQLLQVGAEIFIGTSLEGKAPMSTITTEGSVFQQIINPQALDYQDLINSWRNIEVYHNNESIDNPSHNFSDESLLRVLRDRWMEADHSRAVCNVSRSVNIKEHWIDRSWWKIDKQRLKEGEYVTCNFLRPFDEHYEEIFPIVEYIFSCSAHMYIIPSKKDIILATREENEL